MTAPTEWYRASFASDYLRIYQHRNAAEAEAAVAAALGWLAPPPGAPCLDLCCGFGRHLQALRARGVAAVGMDLSGELLAHGVATHGLGGHLVRGDMRRLPFGNHFAVVFSFFSSFGYFADDAENLLALRELARVLRPGGRFLLDYLNPAAVRAALVPADEQTLGGMHVTQRRWIDEAARTVDKELVVRDAAGERRYRESVKLYGPADFAALLAAAGLRLDRLAGSFAGEPYAALSPRQIMVGTKA